MTSTPTTALSFPPLARLRFRFEAIDTIRMPAYPGSAWRGLLGQGLRRTACVTRQSTCTGCLLVHSCVYSTLFETPAPAGQAAQGYTAMPHPFVLDIDPKASTQLEPGADFDLVIHLMGNAIAQVPYLIHALAGAGERGIGTTRGRFRVCGVEREPSLGSECWESVFDAERGEYRPMETAAPSIPAAPDTVILHLLTPLRIKREGRFVGAAELTSLDLLRVLYRRLRRLAELYGGDPGGFDARGLDVLAASLGLVPQRLHWHEWTRFSSRQNTLMQMGGLIGDILLEGPSVADVWPALWLGQWTHVGKGTAFGLGGYRVRAATSTEDTDRSLRTRTPTAEILLKT